MKDYNRTLQHYNNNKRLKIPIFTRLILNIQDLEILNNMLRQLIGKPVLSEITEDQKREVDNQYTGKQEKLRAILTTLENENNELLTIAQQTLNLKSQAPISKYISR